MSLSKIIFIFVTIYFICKLSIDELWRLLPIWRGRRVIELCGNICHSHQYFLTSEMTEPAAKKVDGRWTKKFHETTSDKGDGHFVHRTRTSRRSHSQRTIDTHGSAIYSRMSTQTYVPMFVLNEENIRTVFCV